MTVVAGPLRSGAVGGAAGARVHAVEPGRIGLEQRLLGILREGADARAQR